MLVLGLREKEADEDYYSKNVRFADPHMHHQSGSEDAVDDAAPSSLQSNPSSSVEGSLLRRGNVTKITLA